MRIILLIFFRKNWLLRTWILAFKKFDRSSTVNGPPRATFKDKLMVKNFYLNFIEFIGSHRLKTNFNRLQFTRSNQWIYYLLWLLLSTHVNKSKVVESAKFHNIVKLFFFCSLLFLFFFFFTSKGRGGAVYLQNFVA